MNICFERLKTRNNCFWADDFYILAFLKQLLSTNIEKYLTPRNEEMRRHCNFKLQPINRSKTAANLIRS
ncbi:hypothetical protein L1887_05639 [Cichorium endivia]|nr:hypothetical protein L1887_05639 [Cichorium endivia]